MPDQKGEGFVPLALWKQEKLTQSYRLSLPPCYFNTFLAEKELRALRAAPEARPARYGSKEKADSGG